MRNKPEMQRILVAARNGHGIALAWYGEVISREIKSGSAWLDDLNAPKPPDGLSIWEGIILWDSGDDPDIHFDGAYRQLAPSERLRFAKTGIPWRT